MSPSWTAFPVTAKRSIGVRCRARARRRDYIPYLWWHGVQSLSGFNLLTNYWFNRDEAAARYPNVSLLHLAYRLFRGMRPEHRDAWRALYDHYVFEADGDPMEQLSPEHRDFETEIDRERLAKLRQAINALLD